MNTFPENYMALDLYEFKYSFQIKIIDLLLKIAETMVHPKFYPYAIFSGMNASVETVAVSKDNHLIVGGTARQALYVWAQPSGDLVQELSDPNLHVLKRIIP